MSNKLSSMLAAVLLVLVFFVLVLLNNQLMGGFRADLTEDRVYSLSAGSKQILKELDEPVHLYFFYSDKASKGMTSLRNYANRVESLLEEYSSLAGDKLVLHKIDPEPFSEAEDQASQFGLTAATIGAAGDSVYLGLAARNAYDDERTIAFFDPQKESSLEYELSKLLYQLSDPQPVNVTLVTDLAVQGGQNPMTGRFDPPWTSFTQLQQLYDVETLGSDAAGLPADTNVLVLVHPQNLSESMLYSIDQYVLNGGKALVFLDPHHESDPMAAMGGANGSELSQLLSAWGAEFSNQQVVLDAAAGLEIRTQTGTTRHLGFLGLDQGRLDEGDVITRDLDMLNGASFGYFTRQENTPTDWQPLLYSSESAAVIDSSSYAMIRDVSQLSADFEQASRYTLAVRLSGEARSAFESVPEGTEKGEHQLQTEALNVILVGDTDFLTDRFWVSQSNFFGQTIYTPFANNGDFLTNAVENLSGSDALISIRSRGTFSRPFEVVEKLTVKAEQSFREQEKRLQQQLEETERQLAQLQEQGGQSGALVLSQQQQQMLDDFMQQKVDIRKALREVRHQLDKDIEQLGTILKFINIALAPIVLVLLLGGLFRLFRAFAGRSL
ncbi:GldG family protein [Lacimicrobium alkaliphilum]|uniref:ABC transporter n=1 Tax=Lacimicrobium alkaliphilum TaxID=1526571 RepID=A0ABQ1R429_9ALTE|nr:Gldg family protein [Lacimicrobium alkaliphilum]GGD56498.1 hypothetical protein GCM10011357_10120 [Lacimicrobium alkaliphilum]